MIMYALVLSGYGVSLFLSAAFVNSFRDEEERDTLMEIFVSSFTTIVLMGIYLFIATKIEALRYFSRFVFIGIVYFVFRPDSLIEAIAIIIMSILPFIFIHIFIADILHNLIG